MMEMPHLIVITMRTIDTRKVRRLTLQSCDLTTVNFVILATSVGCVERADLSRVSWYLGMVFSSSDLVQAAARTTGGNPEKKSGFQDIEIFPARRSFCSSIYYWKGSGKFTPTSQVTFQYLYREK